MSSAITADNPPCTQSDTAVAAAFIFIPIRVSGGSYCGDYFVFASVVWGHLFMEILGFGGCCKG